MIKLFYEHFILGRIGKAELHSSGNIPALNKRTTSGSYSWLATQNEGGGWGEYQRQIAYFTLLICLFVFYEVIPCFKEKHSKSHLIFSFTSMWRQ